MLSDNRPTACFSVYAPPHSAVLPRLFNVLARLDLLPSRVVTTLEGPTARELCIDLQFEDMAGTERETVATRLRSLIDVDLVLTSEKGLRQIA